MISMGRVRRAAIQAAIIRFALHCLNFKNLLPIQKSRISTRMYMFLFASQIVAFSCFVSGEH